MTAYRPLSARLSAAFEGSYEAARASALSGVPISTVYLWARTGLVRPSVSPTRVKLWSYADLMALRIVYWLRHPKSESEGAAPASPMASVRDALSELAESEMDIWEDVDGRLGSPLRVDRSGKIWLFVDGVPYRRGQAALPGFLDLLGPFDYGQRGGPDLLRPRPHLRIVPGRVSGEPHLAGSRITTLSAAALYENLGSYAPIAELYPGVTIDAVRDAVEFERSLAA